MPNKYVGESNLLRYELQLKKNVKKQLNCNKPIMAFQLYNTEFFKKLVQLWYDSFREIKNCDWNKNIIINYDTSPRDLIKQLAFYGLKYLGSGPIMTQINSIDNANINCSRNQLAKKKYLLKNKINFLSDSNLKTSCLQELEFNILIAYKYWIFS